MIYAGTAAADDDALNEEEEEDDDEEGRDWNHETTACSSENPPVINVENCGSSVLQCLKHAGSIAAVPAFAGVIVSAVAETRVMLRKVSAYANSALVVGTLTPSSCWSWYRSY